MKRLALVAVAALAFAVLAAPALSENSPSHPTPQRCRPGAVRAYTAKVWDQNRWRRGDPTKAAVLGFRARLACAPAGHRTELRHFWRDSQRDFYSARQVRLWRARVKPFVYPDGKHWAVPYPIAWCESGGDYFVGPSGAYGLIPPFPQYLSPHRQDEIAHRLYVEQGEGPWAPYEGACAYR